jgi:hypothetical protein
VTVVSAEQEVFRGEVVFGDGKGRVEFVDKDGIPVMIDKWGLLQRPFSGRDPSVVAELVEVTARIIDVLETACGVHAWIAFGSLLGAARGGKVIGHDSDVDIAYLSDQPTPAEMATELYDMARALRHHGFTVQHKTGSFITVVFRSADGATASVDIYTCFHVGDLLYESATVRAPVPRSAILPLRELELEGRLLPAPADPDRMLAVSYGPKWRVPDPSFKHAPGPEVTDRFDGWFGSLMRNRRDWERYLADRMKDDDEQEASPLAGWMVPQLQPDERVVEVGSGTGADALAVARRGFDVLGLDYARNAQGHPGRVARAQDLPATFSAMNLYDLRDVLTRGALVARYRLGPQAVYARDLFEALDRDGTESFWRFTRMVAGVGGRAFLGGKVLSQADCSRHRAEHGGGQLHPVDPRQVAADAVRHGGTVTHREDRLMDGGRAGHHSSRWRMIVEWP